jgi:uncharacterized protein (TIGR03435 family)
MRFARCLNGHRHKCLLLGVALALNAQSTKLEFEVASVHPLGQVPPTPQLAGRVTGGPGSSDPGRIIYSREPMVQHIELAYDVGRDRISGPEWIGMDNSRLAVRFDITAKVPSGTTPEQVKEMLRNLLAERFQLSLHRVTKEFSGYALVVAKGGAKLRESAGPPADSERGSLASGQVELAQDGFPLLFPGFNMGASVKDRVVRDRFRDYSLAELADQISVMVQAHVTDKTGLAGKYDFTLQFETPPNGLILEMTAMVPHVPGQPVGLIMGPPAPGQEDGVAIISAAMEKQFGLRLEPAKVPLDVLVIDHIERNPSEN